MDMPVTSKLFPPLPLDEWEDTKITLHLLTQIVGKIRLGLFPKTNHWWHAPLYVSPRGLTTRPIPYGDMLFEIEFDFIHHVLAIRTSDGANELIPLRGCTVSQFYRNLMCRLADLGIQVKINAVPYDNVSKEPFETDILHASYDERYVNRFWRILVQVGAVFEQFRARYIGKSTPVHLFWHHLDLVVTRFSGDAAPEHTWPNRVDAEAYSHEVISFGFWAGDEVIREPAFYAYMYPEPQGLAEEPLEPPGAVWNTERGFSMAFLPYERVRTAENPKEQIFAFLESAYQASVRRGGWNTASLELQNP